VGADRGREAGARRHQRPPTTGSRFLRRPDSRRATHPTRDLPVDPDSQPPAQPAPESPPVIEAGGHAYDAADAAAAWARRRRDLQHLAGITDVLSEVEQRADD
jgi:hypothetical protein